MNCHNFGKKIILQLYGELNDKETTKLNRHLEKCPVCRLEMAELGEIIKVFQPVEMLEPSPSSGEALRRLARERLIIRTPSWLNRAGKFTEGFALRIPRPVAIGLSLLVLVLALSFYFPHERIPFPLREQIPEEIREMVEWEDGFDEVWGDLQEEIKMVKWAMLISEDGFFEEEIADLEREIFYLSDELNDI